MTGFDGGAIGCETYLRSGVAFGVRVSGFEVQDSGFRG